MHFVLQSSFFLILLQSRSNVLQEDGCLQRLSSSNPATFLGLLYMTSHSMEGALAHSFFQHESPLSIFHFFSSLILIINKLSHLRYPRKEQET